MPGEPQGEGATPSLVLQDRRRWTPAIRLRNGLYIARAPGATGTQASASDQVARQRAEEMIRPAFPAWAREEAVVGRAAKCF